MTGVTTGMTGRIVSLALFAALTACGQVADLEPLPGNSMPVAPYGAHEPKTTAELLELEPQAAPERSVELRRRSEPREDDPFELPPPE